jgi:uncharacterized protein
MAATTSNEPIYSVWVEKDLPMLTRDMRSTSYVFKRSHRIRLEVSSSNFPNCAPNPNTGHPFGADAEVAPADQTVFHDSRYPSRLVLP